MLVLVAPAIMRLAMPKQDPTAVPGRVATRRGQFALQGFTVSGAPPIRLLARLPQATIALWEA